MRVKSPHDSFRYAGEGIFHCFRTQRHMQFHFIMLVLVLLSGLLLALDTRDMVMLLICITLVIAVELVNTAIETVVEMLVQTYSPQAKIAKDVAAGAVLVASANAVIAGLLIFFGNERIQKIKGGIAPHGPGIRPVDVTVVLVVGVIVLTLTVVISKLITGRPNAGILRGGVISGHSAVGFFLAMTIIFTSGNAFVAVLALLMAVIIAQSRVDAGVHTVQEVVLGAVIAIFLTSSVYWVMPHVRVRLQQGGQRPAAARAEGTIQLASEEKAASRTFRSRGWERARPGS